MQIGKASQTEWIGHPFYALQQMAILSNRIIFATLSIAWAQQQNIKLMKPMAG